MFDLKIVIIGDGIARLTAAIEIKIKFLLETKNSIHNNSGMDFMLHSKTINDIHSLPDTELDLINAKINTFVLEDSGNTHNSVQLKGGCVLDTGFAPSKIREHSAVLTAQVLLTTMTMMPRG
jgi:uncharacterized protein YlzI (FlbEa/FlbD family)